MAVNDIQVGGNHYKCRKYQQWDWAVDIGLNYTLGSCAKYVARHRDKSGIIDIIKARHWLDKAIEREQFVPNDLLTLTNIRRTSMFIDQFEHEIDKELIVFIVNNRFGSAKKVMNQLIQEYKSNE